MGHSCDHESSCLCNRLPHEPVRSERDEALDEARQGLRLSRRSIMAGFSLASGAVALPLLGSVANAAETKSDRPKTCPPNSPVKLVLLGTRAGPPPEPLQKGISSALVVDGKTYIIDAGRAAVTQFLEAKLRFDSIAGLFLTHLHADHIADYYNFFMLGGHIKNSLGDHIPPTAKIPVFGPGSGGGLQPAFGGGAVPTVNPANPTPGTAQMTESLHNAYAYSTNVFFRDMNISDPRSIADVREIKLPAGVDSSFEKGHTAPDMKPFEIFDDGTVKVSATLVPHGPVYPAFAFRFDTAYGSVTFSGDTAYSKNLITMAQGTDILVHEVIGVEGANLSPANLDHMLQGHVLAAQAGDVAAKAEAKHLVVSHYADLGRKVTDFNGWTREIRKNYRGQLDIGRDLDAFGLGRGR